MAGTVGADALRADNMDADTNCANIGGGSGTSDEPDIYYQGSGAVSRKVTAAGFYTDTSTARNMTAAGRDTWLAKVAVANFAGATLLELRLGSGTAAWYRYEILAAAGDYPAAGGGFLIIPIDGSVAGYRSTGGSGSPNLASAQYFGCYLEGPTSKAENLVLDSVDLVYGLYVTAGTGGSPATFDDFLSYDEGTIGNRYGVMSSKEGIKFAAGQLVIGATTSGGTRTTTATVFSAADDSIVFPDGRFDAGWSGIIVDLGNASTDVDLDSCSISSRGNTTTTDTRAVLTVLGTSGAFDAVSCTFTNFSGMTLTSACTLDACNIGIADLTQASAEIKNSTIIVATASQVAALNDGTFGASGIHDSDFTQGGSGHAIEITSAGTYTFNSIGFNGFGGTPGTNSTPSSGANDAAVYNSSGGAVTINVSGGDSPSVRNAAGSTTTVANSVSLTIEVRDSGGSLVTGQAEITVTDDSATPVELFHVETSTTGSETYGFDGGDSGNNITILVMTDDYEAYSLDTVLPATDSTITAQLGDDRVFDNPT